MTAAKTLVDVESSCGVESLCEGKMWKSGPFGPRERALRLAGLAPAVARQVREPDSKLMPKLKSFLLSLLVLTAALSFAQPRRKVIINEDCSGPGGSNMQTLMIMIQSPQVEVLGITVVSGDAWRDEEVAHTL